MDSFLSPLTFYHTRHTPIHSKSPKRIVRKTVKVFIIFGFCNQLFRGKSLLLRMKKPWPRWSFCAPLKSTHLNVIKRFKRCCSPTVIEDVWNVRNSHPLLENDEKCYYAWVERHFHLVLRCIERTDTWASFTGWGRPARPKEMRCCCPSM